MIKIAAGFIFTLFITSTVFAQALPAYSGMQSSISGIVGSVAARKGFAANDPRIYSTLNGIGSTATAIASIAAPALLASSGMPAWATLLAM